MNKCSPAEMRNNLEVVELYKGLGLDFVAVPVKSEAHKAEMQQYSDDVLEEIANEAERIE